MRVASQEAINRRFDRRLNMRIAKGTRGKKFLGLDIGASKVYLIVADGRGRVVFRRKWPQMACASAEDELRGIAQKTGKLIKPFRNELCGAGIAAAARVDRKKGIVYSWPNRPSWRGLNLRDEFLKELGIPLIIEDDVNAAAFAEWKNSPQPLRGGVYVLIGVGTGLGCGVVAGGDIFCGTSGQAADLGHMMYMENGIPCGCGAAGCLQTVASGRGIARLAREYFYQEREDGLSLPAELLFPDLWTAESLSKYGAVFPWVRKAFYEAAKALAWSVYQVKQMFDPAHIAVTGKVLKAKSLFREPLFANIRRLGLEALFREGRVGDKAAALGAAMLAKRELTAR